MRRSRGFTLVEMLVAISLLSLVMLGLGSALHTMGQAEQRIDERLSRADEMRMAANFMRTAMSKVSLRRVTLPPPGRPSVLIGAGPQFVAWVGMMPARFGAGGRHFFRIGLEPQASSGSALVLRFVPWTDLQGFPDFSKAESRVLVRDVQSVQMRFLDPEAKPAPAWLEGWVETERAPDRVRIDLVTAHGAWPTLFLPMRGTPQSDPNAGRAAWGPS